MLELGENRSNEQDRKEWEGAEDVTLSLTWEKEKKKNAGLRNTTRDTNARGEMVSSIHQKQVCGLRRERVSEKANQKFLPKQSKKGRWVIAEKNNEGGEREISTKSFCYLGWTRNCPVNPITVKRGGEGGWPKSPPPGGIHFSWRIFNREDTFTFSHQRILA